MSALNKLRSLRYIATYYFTLADLTAHLCKDSVLLQAVAECAKKDVITGLCAEARRLTAALVKNSQCSGKVER